MPGRRVVLLVDPSVDNLDMYAVGLNNFGIKTLTATSGATALEHMQTGQPDAVVTELRFDGLTSGWDLVRQLKADPAARHIPVVILTGLAGATLPTEARSAGCAAAVTKPYLPDDLVQLLGQVWADRSVVSTGEPHHAASH